MCKAQTPVDMVREYQDWVGGAFQRVMADGVACQEFVGALAGPLSSKQEPAPQHPETRTAQHSKAARPRSTRRTWRPIMKKLSMLGRCLSAEG